MNLIALVDKKWGIANKGRELVDIPEDKKLFREEVRFNANDRAWRVNVQSTFCFIKRT